MGQHNLMIKLNTKHSNNCIKSKKQKKCNRLHKYSFKSLKSK